MNKKFSAEQIECLRVRFAGVDTISLDRATALQNILNNAAGEGLAQLANAGIKFVSVIARRTLRTRQGGVL
jgi:hypothetical protein